MLLPLLPACPSGLYGENCQQACLCRNGGTCDPVSGHCACVEGWAGPACEQGELWVGRGRTGVPGALREPGLAPHGPRCSPLPRRPRPASCSGQGRHPGCSLRPAGRPAPAPLLPGDQGRHGGPRVVAPPQEVTSPHSRAAECLPGRPGARCPRSCGCRHGGRCDPHTGSCLCPAGWTGDECQSCEWDGLGAGARRPWGPAPGAGPRQGGQLSGAAGVPVRGPRPGTRGWRAAAPALPVLSRSLCRGQVRG